MNSSIFRFTLDLQRTQSQVSIPVTQGDTLREFHISLSDGGVPYHIVDGCIAKITIERPSGLPIEEDCIIANNTTVIYAFSQNSDTTSVDGVHKCYVTLYDLDGTQLVSSRFTMVVNTKVGSNAPSSSVPKIAVIDLLASKWVGDSSPYSQVVTVEGATANSQVDITPSVEQLSIFYEKDVTFVTENDGGVITVYAIGQKPANDYAFQVTITEVKI